MLESLPLQRPAGRPFDLPEELARLREEEEPLTRLVFPDGHRGWLVTGHTLTRAVVSDPRFSSRRELMHNPMPGPVTTEIPPAGPGMFIGHDAPEHTRYRRLLMGKFTLRRMRQLTERVEEITAAQLDAMERQGPVVDLVRAYAQPIPALLICELLGVPYDEHETFQRHTMALNDHSATAEERGAAMDALGTMLYDLVVAKRAAPTDDVLGDLAAGDELTDEELTNIAVLLLGAGLDTTANMIALGTFALLQHPEQLAAMCSGPEVVDTAVEELLRYLSIAHTGVRVALEDVELDGRQIKAGESVTLSVMAANRDPAKFTDPDRLDVRRRATGHVALGYGIHQCLGQQLARVEMRVALPAVFARFPGLRLAVPAGDVPLRTDSDIYGVERLPVTW